MSSTIASLALALAISASGWNGPGGGSYSDTVQPGYNHNHNHAYAGGFLRGLFGPGGRIVGPGPGYGWGFPNGAPDNYGNVDYGTALPLGPNRVPEYYFPRYLSSPANQMFVPTYYNPYVTRGQRYLPYAGAGGDHPAGGLPLGSSAMPDHPYRDTIGSGPRVALPPFNGRVGAPPVNSGATGLTP